MAHTANVTATGRGSSAPEPRLSDIAYRRILEAAAARDADAAEAAITAHFQAALHRILRLF